MKIAVFPGSFDPFTIAHQDLVERGLGVFDKVIVAIGNNSSKVGLMDVERKKEAISSLFAKVSNVEVVTYHGLTVDFCVQVGAKSILRGLRNVTDLDFENAIAQNNLILQPEIESYFLLARTGKSHISSTIVRDILKNGGDVSHLVPKEILAYLL